MKLGTREQSQLYLLSLYFLFVIVAVLTFRLDFILLLNDFDFKKVKSEDFLFLFSIIQIIYCEYLRRQFKYYLKGGGEDTLKVMRCEGEDYESLTFLATYIVPFAGMSFDSLNKVIAYLILILVIGVIFVRTEKYYANPTLAIFGYKLYKTDLSDSNAFYQSILIITKNEIKIGDNVSYKFLSNSVCFARDIKL
ncbi:hypothetical protein GCM10007906_03450 [Vibrio hyugaensis]|uniref:Uncharacterized protein n=1 Tax=Vibrio hyugaensis TaxID=1534743 RepID=A0ABQ5XYV5_9VIBR|nr:anti-phage protein KwaA [Vibrio hyugaensis]GLR02758.1 hypothetical protein GCM10007906_03450 [Vibrio hyugaensis]